MQAVTIIVIVATAIALIIESPFREQGVLEPLEGQVILAISTIINVVGAITIVMILYWELRVVRWGRTHAAAEHDFAYLKEGF